MNFTLLLSSSEGGEGLPVFGPLNPRTGETLILLGVLSLVIVALLIWAALIRKRHGGHHHHHRHHHHHHHRHNRQPVPAEGAAAPTSADPIPDRRERRRHRRREHRPLNPTLAETGGLPPIRRPGLPGPPPPGQAR